MFGSEPATAFEICFKNVVLPAFGGATIRPRVPLPMGQSRSIARIEGSVEPFSRLIHSLGSIGVLDMKSFSASLMT